jgi:hypothetical protein
MHTPDSKTVSVFYPAWWLIYILVTGYVVNRSEHECTGRYAGQTFTSAAALLWMYEDYKGNSMKANPSGSRTALRSYNEHVVEVSILKSQLQQRGFSVFPALSACAIHPLPRMTDAGDSLQFRFHLEDWNNVVNDFLDDRSIPFVNFRVLTKETNRAKGIQFQ